VPDLASAACSAPYETMIVAPSIAIDSVVIIASIPLLFIDIVQVDKVVKVLAKNHILKNSKF
jgi:hypothetical protein